VLPTCAGLPPAPWIPQPQLRRFLRGALSLDAAFTTTPAPKGARQFVRASHPLGGIGALPLALWAKPTSQPIC